MPKQYVSRWLVDMLESGPYTDERETRAENQRIRANPHETVNKIWAEQEKKLPAPPLPPPAPLPTPPDWGNSPPPAPIPATPPLPPSPPPDLGGDPGIGPVSQLAEPLPGPTTPPPPAVAPPLPSLPQPLPPAPTPTTYWS